MLSMCHIFSTNRFLAAPFFLPHCLLIFNRTFVDARIKWVRDPFLDTVVEREKNLIQCLSLKNLLLSSPSISLPISLASLHKSRLNLPATVINFFLKYPSLFHVFRSCSGLCLPYVKLTPEFLTLHQEEQEIHNSLLLRESAAQSYVYIIVHIVSEKVGLVYKEMYLDPNM
uniref:PORR domain-containing protein n=1 Tax=Opuntia streptacantha TaxID=393608 RepID=A0A7C9DGU1_OPUST